MLSTDERKNRLEALLFRVQRNRVSRQEERVEAQGEIEILPMPEEPIPTIATISSIPPAAPIEEPAAPLAQAIPSEPPPLSAQSQPEMAPISDAPDTEIVPDEPSDADEPEVEMVAQEPSLEPPSVLRAAPELPDDDIEVEDEAPTIQAVPEPAVVEAAPSVDQQPTAPADAVHVFEAETVATGEVAVVHGEPDQSWTLQSVLTRAWKLGLTK